MKEKETAFRLLCIHNLVVFVSDSHVLFSPFIVATTFLECFAARNSRYQMPCHVPVASFPFVIGIETELPISALFTCA
jgi:hypothetical protein